MEANFLIDNWNPDVLYVHTNVNLYKIAQSKNVSLGCIFSDALSEIPGVSDVAVSRYEARLSVARLFDATEICAAIEKVIREKLVPNTDYTEAKIIYEYSA